MFRQSLDHLEEEVEFLDRCFEQHLVEWDFDNEMISVYAKFLKGGVRGH